MFEHIIITYVQNIRTYTFQIWYMDEPLEDTLVGDGDNLQMMRLSLDLPEIFRREFRNLQHNSMVEY